MGPQFYILHSSRLPEQTPKLKSALYCSVHGHNIGDPAGKSGEGMRSRQLVLLLAGALGGFLLPVTSLWAQALSRPAAPACPPQVNPVRNTTIKVYITTELAAPSSMGMMWGLTTRDLFVSRLNSAATADGNRFIQVGSTDSANVDLNVTVDNTNPNMVYTLKMISWNSLEVSFSTPSGEESSDAIKTLVEKIYPYFHLGYQAGPDACRPWLTPKRNDR
jgi:hypothetical protein